MSRAAILSLALAAWPLVLPQAGRAAAPPRSATLTLENERGKATTFSAADLARLPQHKAKVKGHGGAATYEGASLADVLLAANATLGKGLRGPLLGNCLLAEAADGYRAVFSLAEIDPSMTDNVVLIALRKDGKALDGKEGPFRIIVPHDKLGMRWVKQLTRLSVVPAGSDRAGRAAVTALDGKVFADEKAPGGRSSGVPVLRVFLPGTTARRD